jgi:hypothetical protein
MRIHEIFEGKKYHPYAIGSPMRRFAYCYHGTPLANIPSIVQFGLSSHLRPKYSANWSAGKPLTRSEARQYELLYFTFEPVDWGTHHHRGPAKNLRFHINALPRGVKWQEDETRGQEEYYAISRQEFSIPPQALEIWYQPPRGKLVWIPVIEYYNRYYHDDPDLDKVS